MAIALLTFGAAFGLSAIVLVWMAIHGYRMYREVRVVTCPETRAPAAVRLHAARAAVTNLTGYTDFRLSSCSRWPELRNCGQECLSQIKAVPRWNCHMEESFRTLHPDLAARAPSRGRARESVAS